VLAGDGAAGSEGGVDDLVERRVRAGLGGLVASSWACLTISV
jgi:hypothetical protein